MRRLLLVVALGACAALLVSAPAGASGASPCGSRVINDWYDNGKIDKIYPVSCYRDALHNLPEEIIQYANATDVITAAMKAAIVAANHKTTQTPGNPPETVTGGTTQTPTTQTSTSSTATTKTTTTETSTTETGKTATTAGPGPNHNEPDPPVTHTIKVLGPSNADSVPVPLIVLGVLGLLLLAAGAAGVVARKLQERRTPATPGGSPPVDTPPAA